MATSIGSHLTREPTVSPVLTKWWMWELILTTNFGRLLQMVTKVGSHILATKFGFVPDCKGNAPLIISLKFCNIFFAVMGAFAKKVIQKRTEFGPFEGDLMPMWPHKGKGLFAVKVKSYQEFQYNDTTFKSTTKLWGLSRQMVWRE